MCGVKLSQAQQHKRMQISLWRTWGSATAKELESGPLAVFLKKTTQNQKPKPTYLDNTTKDQRLVADKRRVVAWGKHAFFYRSQEKKVV